MAMQVIVAKTAMLVISIAMMTVTGTTGVCNCKVRVAAGVAVASKVAEVLATSHVKSGNIHKQVPGVHQHAHHEDDNTGIHAGLSTAYT